MKSTVKAYGFFFVPEFGLPWLNEGAVSETGPARTISSAEDIFNFDLLDKSTRYLAGIDHPAFAGRPQKWGDSMRDAFSPFEAGLVHRYGKIEPFEGYADVKLDQFSVTFGSPNSNNIARMIYGSDVDADGRFIDAPAAARSAVAFENASNDSIRRAAGYPETHRGLRLANGKRFVPVHKDGVLGDDYLLISHVTLPGQDALKEAEELDARIRQIREGARKGTSTAEENTSLPILEQEREKIEIKTVLCVSGLYGPGTGAARILFSRTAMLNELRAAVRGKRTFHAIYHVPRITRRKVKGVLRDLPAEISRAPIEVLPAD